MKKILYTLVLLLLSPASSYAVPGHALCSQDDQRACCDQEPIRWCYNSSETIFKILTEDQWELFKDAGDFHGAPVDIADGFIHLAKPDQQLDYVLSNFFKNRVVIIVEIESAKLGDHLRWENEYPHLYDIPLSLDHIKNFSLEEGHGFARYHNPEN